MLEAQKLLNAGYKLILPKRQSIQTECEKEDTLDYYSQFSSRAKKFTPPDVLESIPNQRVLVIGTGGVGSNALLALLQQGFGRRYTPDGKEANGIIVYADDDIMKKSDGAKMAGFSYCEIGKPKVEVMAKMIEHYDPFARFIGIQALLNASNFEEILDKVQPDYIIEAADGPSKLLIHKTAFEYSQRRRAENTKDGNNTNQGVVVISPTDLYDKVAITWTDYRLITTQIMNGNIPDDLYSKLISIAENKTLVDQLTQEESKVFTTFIFHFLKKSDIPAPMIYAFLGMLKEPKDKQHYPQSPWATGIVGQLITGAIIRYMSGLPMRLRGIGSISTAFTPQKDIDFHDKVSQPEALEILRETLSKFGIDIGTDITA